MSDAQEVADDDAVFISAEEVTNEVDIGEAPEESDDENDMDVAGGAGGDAEEEGGEGDEAKTDGPAFAVPAQDDSFATFAAHEDAIYDVAAAVVDGAVVIASGSGDDSAVLTKLGSTAQDTRSVKLSASCWRRGTSPGACTSGRRRPCWAAARRRRRRREAWKA